MNTDARCKATRTDGKPCEAHPRLIGDDGFCFAHAPGAKERLREQGRRGGRETARKWRVAVGLLPGELPELVTPHDAQKALAIVAYAAAEGRLPQRQADSTTRALREWLRAHDAGVMADQVAELRSRMDELKGGKKKLRSVK